MKHFLNKNGETYDIYFSVNSKNILLFRLLKVLDLFYFIQYLYHLATTSILPSLGADWSALEVWRRPGGTPARISRNFRIFTRRSDPGQYGQQDIMMGGLKTKINYRID